MKILYFDTETTGLDPKIHDVISLAWIIEENGIPLESGYLFFRPVNTETIDSNALEVNGFSKGQLLSFPLPSVQLLALEKVWSRYVDPSDKTTRFIPCAYNAEFDLQFCKSLWDNTGLAGFYKWVDPGKTLDPLPVLRMLSHAKRLLTDSHKLTEMTDLFAIPHANAHDAMSDCEALRELTHLLQAIFMHALPVLNPPPLDSDIERIDSIIESVLSDLKINKEVSHETD